MLIVQLSEYRTTQEVDEVMDHARAPLVEPTRWALAVWLFLVRRCRITRISRCPRGTRRGWSSRGWDRGVAAIDEVPIRLHSGKTSDKPRMRTSVIDLDVDNIEKLRLATILVGILTDRFQSLQLCIVQL